MSEKNCKVCSARNSSACGGCVKVYYCGKQCQRKDRKQHENECFPAEIVLISSVKGRGLVATKDIKQGQQILIDTSVLTFDNTNLSMTCWIEIRELADNLSAKEKELFYSLKPKPRNKFDFDEKRMLALRIYLNNSIDLGDSSKDSKSRAGIFLKLSMLNHSCCPNSRWSALKENKEAKELRALKDISKGEEITVSYIGSGSKECMEFPSKIERNRVLAIGWCFQCNCPVCDLEGERFEKNEGIRGELRKIQKDVESTQNTEVRANLLLKKLRLLKSMGHEMISDLGNSYAEAYYFSKKSQNQSLVSESRKIKIEWENFLNIFPMNNFLAAYEICTK